MLYIVATPLGNLGDISRRAIDVLSAVPVIACEDTRRTWALLSSLGIPRPQMISYREGVEERAGARLLGLLSDGTDVALCTDGGYPGISDPGFRLVRSAADADIGITVVPGPCAAEIALVMSGLPTSSWTFKGFPPRKPSALRRYFSDEADSPHTLVGYESPFRIAATLKAAAECLGERRAVVCFELTKIHEHVERGTLEELSARMSDRKIKGEITFVIEGKRRAKGKSNEENDED